MSANDLLQHTGRVYPRGSVLFGEGDAGRDMYVVQQGRVALTRRRGSADTLISTAGPGEFFGYMSVLCGRPRASTATVTDDATLLVIDARAFERLVRGSSDIALELIRQLAQQLAERLRDADDRLSTLALPDARSRVAHCLSTAADRAQTGAGPVRLAIRPGDLPALLGLSPAEARTSLDELARSRMVDPDPRGIVVTDAPRLERFLEFLLLQGQFGDVM